MGTLSLVFLINTFFSTSWPNRSELYRTKCKLPSQTLFFNMELFTLYYYQYAVWPLCVWVGEREGNRLRARYRVFVVHCYVYVTLGNDLYN